MLTNKKNIILNKKGFSMLEMIVVLSIFSIGILGIASLMMQTMQAEATNTGYLKASLLAQEGLEMVRGYRDDNWLDPALPDWDKNFGDTDGTFILDYSGTRNDAPDSINDPLTLLNLSGGYYAHVPGAFTGFRRLITISDCVPFNVDCWEVGVEIDWSAAGRGHSYTVSTTLYNWR